MTGDVTQLETAVLVLADAHAFDSADVGFGHACAARIRVNAGLVPDSRRRMYRLLSGYRNELAKHGIDYDAVEPPADTPRASAAAAAAAQASAVPIHHGRTRVWVDDRGLWMRSPFTAKDLVRSHIPSARWKKSHAAYLLPATGAAAMSIAETLGRFGVDADDAATALVLAGRKQREAGLLRASTELPPIPHSRTVAWNHQLQAFWFARELPGAILDMEMGTGKSKVVVDLIGDSRAESVMIVCPERVVGVWPKQFGIHSGLEQHIIDPRRQNRRGEWLLLPVKDRVEMYEHALHECGCGLTHVLMTNYSASAHEPFKSWSLRQHFDYVAYDECHRLRSHGGVWSQWAEKMHKHADKHIGGTGTMQSQTPLDVFAQARAVEPGVFGDTYIAFEKRYAIKGGYQGRKVIDYTNEDELAQKIATFTYHAGEEVLDLPPLMPDVDVVGHMSAKARKLYDALEQELYAEVIREMPDGSIVYDETSIPNVLVKILRCQQMTGGNLALDSGILEEIDTAKRDLLSDELEDFADREPVVVFARFIPDLDNIARVAETLGRPYHELSGRRSDALTSDATLNPAAVIAGVQIQAGGTGVDFTRACYGIYYSVGHSLGDYLQSRKRLHRPGQDRAVRFRHLIMDGTIDVDVYQALAARKRVVDRIADKVRALQARKAQ